MEPKRDDDGVDIEVTVLIAYALFCGSVLLLLA